MSERPEWAVNIVLAVPGVAALSFAIGLWLGSKLADPAPREEQSDG